MANKTINELTQNPAITGLEEIANEKNSLNYKNTYDEFKAWLELVKSTTTGEPTGSDLVVNIVSLTQAEYDAGTPVATTFYIITDA